MNNREAGKRLDQIGISSCPALVIADTGEQLNYRELDWVCHRVLIGVHREPRID